MQELLTVELARIREHLGDLGQFLLAPRRFLERVAAQPGPAIAYRLIVYALAFSALELALVSVSAGGDSPGTYELVGIAAFEILFSLFYAPTFALVAVALGRPKPVTTALVYALTFRFVFLTVPLLFFVLFVATEDYSFALLKGVTAWGFLLAYVLAFPLIIASSLRERSMGLLAAVVLGLGTIFFATYLVDFSGSRDSRLREFSLFFDPIGDEMDRFELTKTITVGGPVDELYESVRQVLKPSRDTIPAMLIVPKGFRASWPAQRERALAWLKTEEEKTTRSHTKARFQTTERLLDARLAEIAKAGSVVRAADRFMSEPLSTTNYTAFLEQNTEAYKATHAFALRVNELLTLRLQLLRLGLITY